MDSGKAKKFLASVGTLVSGSMLGQLVTIICSPILTRIVKPEDLGLYTLVIGAVTMFGAIMSFRYEMCIVYESDENKVNPLIKLSMIICALLSIMIAVGYYAYFLHIDLGNHSISLAIAAGLLVFLMGIINIVTAYNNRYQQYKLITTTYIQRTVAQNACNLGAGYIGLGGIGLAYSQVIGYLVGIRGQSKDIWKRRKAIGRISITDMVQVARENNRQALLSTPAALANGLSFTLISYFIEALFSRAIVGYYSISYRILGLPISIISANVSRVFLERASSEFREKGNFITTYKWTLMMAVGIGIPMATALILLAPWACELFFGKGWRIAGEYIRLLAPMFVMRFIAGCVNNAAIIINKQQIDFIIQWLLTGVVFIIFIYARYASIEVEQFLKLLNICFCLVYAIYIFLFGLCAKGEKNAES